MKVTKEPFLRFEHSYGGILTVLEGQELENLLSTFRNDNDVRSIIESDDETALVVSAAKAYQRIYGEDVVTQDELKNLNIPDARKMDLLYRGIREIFG